MYTIKIYIQGQIKLTRMRIIRFVQKVCKTDHEYEVEHVVFCIVRDRI